MTNVELSDKADDEPGPDTLIVSKPVRSRLIKKKKTLCQKIMNFGGSVRINPTGVAILCAVVILLIFFNSGGSTGSGSSKVGKTVNLKQLLSVAIAAAEAGGREVVAVRKEADLGGPAREKH